MAATIQLLEENIINKIAAGEVVERPASVVKELVENSIDAGAAKVNVAIRAGGKQSIVVSDDGVGMGREDIGMCVHRHATSKISSASDLFQIDTLGFRGEALASIGAIAHLSIESRSQADEEGARLVVEGGIEREMHGIGRATGTTITVRNLFFNTPARRKFMRHVDTEARHISQIMIHLAASYPAIGFELQNEERSTMNYSPATRQQRATDLLGVTSRGLLDVQYEQEGLKVEGVLAVPEFCDRSRGKQYIVVRGRPIHSRPMVEAVIRGYGGLLSEGRSPLFMLWLDMDSRKIDVNVHPTKREIRFANEAQVTAAVKACVRSSLRMPDAQSFIYDSQASNFRPAKIGEPSQFDLNSSIELNSPKEEFSVVRAINTLPDQLSFSLIAPSSVPKSDSSAQDIDTSILHENPKMLHIYNKCFKCITNTSHLKEI